MTDEIENATGAYSLDALSDEERQRFEAHLASDASAQTEVDEFLATAARLAAAEATAPPGHLRQRVLDETARTRQVPPEGARVAPLRSNRTRVALRIAAIAAVVVGVVAATVLYLGGGSDGDEADQIVAVMAEPDTEFVELTGDSPTRLRVAWSPVSGEAVLLGSAVAAPAGDRTYELWFVKADGPEPGLVFRPDADGRVEELFATDLAGVDSLAVTEEPAGGSPLPTGAVLLAGERI